MVRRRKVLHVAGVKNKIISREKGRWLSALAVEFSRKDRRTYVKNQYKFLDCI